MKIFLVCNSLGEGGAERVHVNLANGFVQRGHEVWLVVDLTKKATYPVDERVQLLQLFPPKNNKILKWGGAIFKLRKYLRKYKPDVVIGNMHLCSFISRLATIGIKVPVVLTIHHALESETYDMGWFVNFCDRHAPSLYAATTVLTEADKDVMENIYGRHSGIFVMPNLLTYIPAEKIPEKECFVLAAGRIDQWQCKGWDILLKAWGRLHATVHTGEMATELKKWKLKIAGAGHEETFRMLKDMAREHGVGASVEFIGYQSDMMCLYKKAPVFCLSSRSEGLPMVLIEAMSQGCAPVATDYKGRTASIIIDSKTGFLCFPEDVEGLCEGLRKMIFDAPYRLEVQRNSIERAKCYVPDQIISLWEKKLNQIV